MTDLCTYKPKVHWTVKVCAFVASVISLSWFFAGWRQVHESPAIGNWLALAGGIVSTLFLVGLQGYWIYFDEKAKGTLRKRIRLYEIIHDLLSMRKTRSGGCSREGKHGDARG